MTLKGVESLSRSITLPIVWNKVKDRITVNLYCDLAENILEEKQACSATREHSRDTFSYEK